MPISLAYPSIDPVLITIGPLPIRWYALAYIAGLVLGWAYARALVRQKSFWGGAAPLDPLDIDDLLVYVAMGVILGGRLGYVLFYNAGFYLAHPAEIFAVWRGGMSFHGGLAGTALAIYVLATRKRISVLSLADVCAAAHLAAAGQCPLTLCGRKTFAAIDQREALGPGHVHFDQCFRGFQVVLEPPLVLRLGHGQRADLLVAGGNFRLRCISPGGHGRAPKNQGERSRYSVRRLMVQH